VAQRLVFRMVRRASTILILVDDVDMMIALTKALQMEDCAVVGTRRREQALALLKDVPSIKLIVIDLTLSGVEFIRRACRDRTNLGVLFLTDGMDDTPFRQSDSVLVTPFKLTRFIDVVRRILVTRVPETIMDLGLGPDRRRAATIET
jgi:DNA-binding response OmpR family regulator